MKALTFQEIQDFLYKSISDKIDIGYSAGFALERVKYTMSLLDNPQDKLKIIHVAGTSGKGSTVSFISQILEKHGMKTGHTLSPHLIDIRERIQINNNPLTKSKFSEYFNELLPIFDKVEKSKYGKVSYFEMLMIMAYYIFYKEKVNFAIIETGLGGTFDASNCVKSPDKLCVITKIGKDHTHILGNTISEIAENKAGIINEKQSVVYVRGAKFSDRVIEKRAKEMKSENFALDPNQVLSKANSRFSFLGDIFENLDLTKLPLYQIENFSVALATICILANRHDFKINHNMVNEVVRDFSFPGRFEKVALHGNTFVIDGAHNPQKMSAFITSLKEKLPNQKFNFIVAFKEDKDCVKMIKTIEKIAKSITFTKFNLPNQDIKLKSANPVELEGLISNNTPSKITSNLREALEKLESTEPITIVTGSLYLIAEFKSLTSKQ